MFEKVSVWGSVEQYRAVVLNRGAAEPLGAAESSRGAANF